MITRNDFNYGLQIEATYSITQENGDLYINSGMIGVGLTFSGGLLESTGPTGPSGDIYLEITISSAEILDAFDTPIELVPAQGANTIILPISMTGQMIYNTTPYATDGEIDIYCGGNRPVFGFPSDDGFLFGTVSRIVNLRPAFTSNTTDTQYVANQPLTLKTVGSNPTAGDSDVTIRGFYKIINI